MLDGNIAGGRVRDVDRTTGSKLGDEPLIVRFAGCAMDDDRRPVDTDVENEIRRRNLLLVLVKVFADGRFGILFLRK